MPTGRDRILAALRHVELDRVPVDIAATASSAIEPRACAALRRFLGLSDRDDGGDALEEVLGKLAPDVGRVRLGNGGGVMLWHGKDLSGAPTGGTIDTATWPDPGEPAWYFDLRRRAERQRQLGRAVVLDTEIGLVDGCVRLRGTLQWLADLLEAPAFAEQLMERVAQTCAEVLRHALGAIGDAVDAVVVYEDLAGQNRPLVSPELYRRLVKPHHAQVVDAIRSRSSATVLLHCDGAVSELLPDFVEIGVEAVNPVQTSARGMDPVRLKRLFGRNLSFWGGFDAAQILSFGTPRQVEAEATRVAQAFARGGGYVFAPAHPIDDSVPPANLAALVRAAQGYRVPR